MFSSQPPLFAQLDARYTSPYAHTMEAPRASLSYFLETTAARKPLTQTEQIKGRADFETPDYYAAQSFARAQPLPVSCASRSRDRPILN